MANETATKADWSAAIAATLLLFVVAMDQVMMPIATSAIVAGLKTNVGLVQAAIALVSLVAAPLYITGSKLGDIHGKKRIFNAGLILYGVGTLTATLAPSMVVLIGGWSVVRGVAMALTIPTSVGLIMANYEGGQRGQAFAMYGAGGVAAALVGPLLMGFSADTLSWRVPFGIETLVIAATIFLTRSLKETEKIKGMRVDWGGTALVALSVGSIILGSMLGGRYGWWLARRPFTIGSTPFNPFGLSPAPLLIAFGFVIAAITLNRIYHMEEKGKQPLFSIKLFDDRTFAATWAMAMLVFVLSGAIPFIVPVFLQQAIGFDGLQSGLAMVAFSIGSIILGFASGSLVQRMQPRTLMQLFILIAAVGVVWLFAIANVNMGLSDLLLPMFVIGAGFGALTSQIPNVQLSNLPPKLVGEGSGMAEVGKEIGTGLGTAVIGSIMFALALGGLVDSVAKKVSIPLTVAERSAIIVQLEDESFPKKAADSIAQQVPNLEQLSKEAYVEGFQISLGVLTAVLLAALLIASFIPKVEPVALARKMEQESGANG